MNLLKAGENLGISVSIFVSVSALSHSASSSLGTRRGLINNIFTTGEGENCPQGQTTCLATITSLT
jgi:hypothetical protein